MAVMKQPGVDKPLTPKPAATGPADPEAHFRLDEHERQLHEIGKNLTPEAVAGVVHGAVAALHVTMQAETEKLLKAVREDVETDKSVVAAIGELCTDLKALVAALHELATRRV
jgi:hypothetical protein